MGQRQLNAVRRFESMNPSSVGTLYLSPDIITRQTLSAFPQTEFSDVSSGSFAQPVELG